MLTFSKATPLALPVIFILNGCPRWRLVYQDVLPRQRRRMSASLASLPAEPGWN